MAARQESPMIDTDSAEAGLDLARAASLSVDEVVTRLGSGLTGAQAAARLARWGPNAVTNHRARLLPVLWRQLRSALLLLLVVAAVASFFLGERADAVIISVILVLSVGLGFVNEYRAERAADALHQRIRRRARVTRDGQLTEVDVIDVVPGDRVELRLGDIVAADLRLISVSGLECDESALTGESAPVAKGTAPVAVGAALAELECCALMGTVVHAGTGSGVVVATGARAEFGRIAAGLGTHQTQTEFQVGLGRFSLLLAYVAAALTASIFVINVALHKPILDALLFSLAIAVGITPQLLPAVVSLSLSAGSRQMARRSVLVKRLVCIEDLGDVGTLFTDKTGTLTQDRISFMRAVAADSCTTDDVVDAGLRCCEGSVHDGQLVGGTGLDAALWASPVAASRAPGLTGHAQIAALPFDHDRRMSSVLISAASGATLITKGAPESVLARCRDVPPSLRAALDAELADGNRVVAVAQRSATGRPQITADDEQGLNLLGLLVFLDPPKPDAAEALRRLDSLGITVKILTGDNATVAEKVCRELGLDVLGTLTGADIDRLDDTQLADAIGRTTVFARVSPEHKARVVRVQRLAGADVAFLGDGVNDALALHAADIGISVDSATDVAKDAADVILLDKSLGVLADGVAEGRRIFANTIKYVLMGTSSNFGNMFSAAGASIFLSFLPMLPSQVLLNNLLYDTSQLAIPTDNVDEEQLRRPSHWDIRFIRRFMLYFGPLSSVFDFATFGLMLWVFHAGPTLFRTGWFVESLATQTLVIFAIRTRRVPFTRSHPSLALTLSAVTVVVVAAILPVTPLAGILGFQPLPTGFFAALVALVVGYLTLVEWAKRIFYRQVQVPPPTRSPRLARQKHLRHRAAYFNRQGWPRWTALGLVERLRPAAERPGRAMRGR
jgi:Mg2+-importing ATPase